MSDSILLTGLLLGVVQLVVGIGIGYWIASPRAATQAAAKDSRRARRLAGELRSLTANLSQQARDQGEQLGRVDARLQTEAHALAVDHRNTPLTSLVTGVVREMMLANQQLQDRLMAAELELESRVAEVAEHLQTAMTDPLTGLPNRRALDDYLTLRMDAWRKHKTSFSVVMVDVDHFKKFNDTHGHAVGDEALKAVGAALRSALRQHDIVARYGGEEFAIVLPHTTRLTAQAAVGKAIAAVREVLLLAGNSALSLTASGGLASVGPTEQLESLMKRADQALYQAKQAGRDQAWLHDGVDLLPLTGQVSHDPQAGGGPLDPDLQRACSDLTSSLSELLAAGPAQP